MANTTALELESYHWVEQLQCSSGQKELMQDHEVAALHLYEQQLQEGTGQHMEQDWSQNLEQKVSFH